MESQENKTPIAIEEEMRTSYLDYAMSVIVGRALPDVRDGLKPVHRRVLFAMHLAGNTAEKPYRKSAKITGDVNGNYHPHGTNAIYDAMVRLGQEFGAYARAVERDAGRIQRSVEGLRRLGIGGTATGAVTESVKRALMSGWSKHGKTRCAEYGSRLL